jgi:hypothetical protein
MSSPKDLCDVCKHEREKHDTDGCNFTAAIPDKNERICGGMGDWGRYNGPRCAAFVEPTQAVA